MYAFKVEQVKRKKTIKQIWPFHLPPLPPLNTDFNRRTDTLGLRKAFVNRKQVDVISGGLDRGKLFPEVDTALLICTPKIWQKCQN